jgi:hypothetical protein
VTSTGAGDGGTGWQNVTDFLGEIPSTFTGERSEDLFGELELVVLEVDGRKGEPIDRVGIEEAALRRFGDGD